MSAEQSATADRHAMAAPKAMGAFERNLTSWVIGYIVMQSAVRIVGPTCRRC